MKKFLSIVAALALLLTLAVPALAADEAVISITRGEEAVGAIDEATALDENGDELDVTVEVTEADLTEEEEESLQDAAAAAADEAGVDPEEVTVQVVNIDLVDEDGNVVSDEYFDENSGLRLSIVRDDSADVIAVLYWNAETEEWDSADIISQDDGVLVVEVAHLCTFAFVIEKTEKDPGEEPGDETGDDPGEEPGPSPAPGPGGPGGKPASPQTGHNTSLWAAAAVTMALCAAFCFVRSRKKVTE